MSQSIAFFDQQFQKQLENADFDLNPFERAALPYLQGRVLDYGCGLGNLALAAARTGCLIQALDGSATAIKRLTECSRNEHLPITPLAADLRNYEIQEQFDVVVSIGLLMFFDCATAHRQLAQLQGCIRPGGIIFINVLIEGTTFLRMFDPEGFCLFGRSELRNLFDAWEILDERFEDYPAPENTLKAFVTLVARKPA
jgi:tellurite methyltransferase